MPALESAGLTPRSMHLLVLAILLCGSGVLSCRSDRLAVAAVDAGPASLPPVMLWAWHGEHDLRFIAPERTGVAFLAGTVRVSGDSVALLPGTSSVDAPRGTVLLPVVRIEVDPLRRARLDAQRLDDVAASILGFDDRRFRGLQLDFDAKRSERGFYLQVLATVRRALGERFLSVTALPSWCVGDSWLPGDAAGEWPSHLIDEVVPMLFRMGTDGESIRARLADGRDFVARCRSAFGVSADEPVPTLFSNRRLYLFSPDGWTQSSYDELVSRAVMRTGNARL
ncbi:MAG: hypothetical protein OEM62_04785 [Acidobacteriota bacterium]|nr:hypothetical protein [Acidobacteriota bacterium]